MSFILFRGDAIILDVSEEVEKELNYELALVIDHALTIQKKIVKEPASTYEKNKMAIQLQDYITDELGLGLGFYLSKKWSLLVASQNSHA